jgi:phage terminase large subunit-like protein
MRVNRNCNFSRIKKKIWSTDTSQNTPINSHAHSMQWAFFIFYMLIGSQKSKDHIETQASALIENGGHAGLFDLFQTII